MWAPRAENYLHRRCCLLHKEHQVPRHERPISLQHTVGQARTEQAEGGSVDEAYEDEVSLLGGNGDHHQVRPEGS